MHAVIAEILGISELHRRNASPLHICCASALKAKLALDDSAEQATAKASTRPAWRIVLVRDAVIFGSHWPALRGALLMDGHCLNRITPTVMSLTYVIASQRVGAKRRPMTGSAKQSRNCG